MQANHFKQTESSKSDFLNLALLGRSWPRSSGSKWRAIFGLFWLFLGAAGPKLGHPRTDTLPTVSKHQPGCPVTHSMPFQPFGTTRVLKVRFWPFLDHFGPFWGLLDQNWGDPRTPNWVKTSTRMSCNLFHAVPTVLEHQRAQSQILAIFGPFRPFLGAPGPKLGTTFMGKNLGQPRIPNSS